MMVPEQLVLKSLDLFIFGVFSVGPAVFTQTESWS